MREFALKICLSFGVADDDVTQRHMGTAINDDDNNDKLRILYGHCLYKMLQSTVNVEL